MRFGFLLLYMIFGFLPLCAQGIKGIITDNDNHPINNVAIALQKSDSTLVEAAITKEDGTFSFRSKFLPYRLIINHIAYITKIIDSKKIDAGHIYLEEKNAQIQEVVVKASRPVVKVDKGAMLFDTKELMKDRPVNNALDILSQVPMLEKSDNNYKIVSANETSIIINGRRTSMTLEQIKELLASTPSSRVKEIQIFYNSPQKFGINGAAINIIMDKLRSDKTTLNGSVEAKASQAFYFTPSGSMNLALSGKQWSLNTSYSLSRHLDHLGMDLSTRHTLDDQLHLVDFCSSWKMRNFNNLLNSEFNYSFKNKDELTIAYYGQFEKRKYNVFSNINMDEVLVQSFNKQKNDNNLHNALAEYTHGPLTIGVDYTHFNGTSNQLLNNLENDSTQNILSTSKQRVNSYDFYADVANDIGNGTLSYGIDYKYSHTNNALNTWQNEIMTSDTEENFTSKQYEQSIDGYIGWQQTFNKIITLNASVSGEYYKSEMKQDGITTTMWENFHFFPNFTFSYKINPKNSILLTLTSERKYPPYSNTTARRLYINAYTVNQGNPELKPSLSYQLNLNYVLNKKYVFMLYARSFPDYFSQTFYQSNKELKGIYQTVNYDKYHQIGLVQIIPITFSPYFNATFTFNTAYLYNKGVIKDKDLLNTLTFDKKKFYGIYQVLSNVVLSKRNGLSLQFKFFWQTSTINGLYDMSSRSSFSTSFAWKKPKSPWSLVVSGEDLFETNNGKKTIDNGLQQSVLKQYLDYRLLSASVRYSFGGYKEKKSRVVDSSRFDQ